MSTGGRETSSYSIVDMAAELFKKECVNSKHEDLPYLIDQVSSQPDLIYMIGKEVVCLVQRGP